jgi:RNA polymerase sigma-70 factor (ECF subfamily)
MRSEAEPALIVQARHDRAAFAALYDLYVTRVYAFCAVHSASREDAEDLTAQTFERALHAISRYEERGQPFSAWLLRIAAHAAANHARRPTAVPLPSDGPSRMSDDGATAADVQAESWVEEWERADWIEEHLAALPAEQQRVVQLRFYEDRSFSDVAAQMGRSEGAVKQLLRRTLAMLRARIHEEALHDG